MRSYLSGDSSSRQFADNLLQLGNGSFTSLDPDGAVSLKNIGRIVKTEEELLQAVFPNLLDFFQDHVWLCQRAILAPQNQTVNIINKRLLSQIPGNAQIYRS
ncbi:ATP-dependent DNA helicase [Trichonephila clavata]|uniref:ATP-dependent DNA helicase n=1 Tax=Trichonephila clavata TaxID=2740835 RepID=A0A8X6GW46_TRICU|nr:ATP-dependent DNA helicase [Trichonephila clavata]GFR15533.1 ATP-dependent DNA helicase [Trichonephila clavata]